MNYLFLKLIPVQMFIYNSFLISGCQEGMEKNEIVAVSYKKLDENKQLDQNSLVSCKTSTGISLQQCDSKLKLSCTRTFSGEFCMQYLSSGEARMWGPY